MAYATALGRAIVAMRIERGMARKDLAARSGVSYPYVSELEKGTKHGASIQVLEALARALGVRPSAMFLRAETIMATYSQ
jgi:transcriptional regulator with XRE-family HTH domain